MICRLLGSDSVYPISTLASAGLQGGKRIIAVRWSRRAVEVDEFIAATFRGKLKEAKRVYDALQSERRQLGVEINHHEILGEQIEEIKRMAAIIGDRLGETPSLETQRRILTLLDVQVFRCTSTNDKTR